MLQYLLNISCIWTLGLAAYFSLLRKESFHTFNRIYLLGLLVAGIAIPFITWQTPVSSPTADVPITYTTPYSYAEQSSAIKQQVVAVVQPTSNVGIAPILWSIYFAGVFLMLLMLAKELFKIIRLYRGSIKTTMQGYTLIETNKETAPFSIADYIFISGRDNYDTEEYNLIIAHELRHIQLKHTIDLILLYVLQTIFWFHPLVYIVRKNLLLVHEYQADKIAQQSANNYGLFLIEQAMLSPAPIISHSFAHSPLKNRIMMLTKKSARIARAKMLVVVPLALVSVLAFSNCNNNSLSPMVNKPETKGTVGTYKGNIVELELRENDTAIIHDSETGKPKTIISDWADRPLTLNGKTIHIVYPLAYLDDVDIDTEPTFPTMGPALGDYLFKELKDDFETLDDGRYNIIFPNIVIDETGAIAFYQYSGVQKIGPIDEPGDGMVRALDEKIIAAMDKAPAYTPALVAGKPVPCKVGGLFDNGKAHDRIGTTVLVKNHKAVLYSKPQEEQEY